MVNLKYKQHELIKNLGSIRNYGYFKIKILKEESDSAFCMLLGSRLKSAEPEYLKVFFFARLSLTLGRCKSVFLRVL